MKRILDIVAAAFGLLLLSPVIIGALIAIRLDSPGSPIFAQPRVGRGGRMFVCYKMRTMYLGTAHRPTHLVERSAQTPIGNVLRRWKLDELPQLFNVLLGDMTLVGPRPCLSSQTELIEARSREGALDAVPGITGLAQVQGIDMSDPLRLAAVDGLYVKTRTFGGDLLIIMQTLSGSFLRADPATSGAHRSVSAASKDRAE